MNLGLAVAGVALLVLGWKLFWLFVGVVGFAAGLQAAPLVFGPQPFWMFWAAGLMCGIIGAILALFLQNFAIAIGGFAAGGIIAIHLMSTLGHTVGLPIALIGGVVGMAALVLLFDWALIILSSAAGASFIAEAVGSRFSSAPALFLALMATGVIFQAALLKASRKGNP